MSSTSAATAVGSAGLTRSPAAAATAADGRRYASDTRIPAVRCSGIGNPCVLPAKANCNRNSPVGT